MQPASRWLYGSYFPCPCSELNSWETNEYDHEPIPGLPVASCARDEGSSHGLREDAPGAGDRNSLGGRFGCQPSLIHLEAKKVLLLANLGVELGVPFAAVRVVADPLERELPPAVHSGLQPDGSVALSAVLDSLAREPGQMLSLARVTLDAYVAFRALLSGREKLGPRFASLVCPTVVAGPAWRTTDALAPARAAQPA